VFSEPLGELILIHLIRRHLHGDCVQVEFAYVDLKSIQIQKRHGTQYSRAFVSIPVSLGGSEVEKIGSGHMRDIGVKIGAKHGLLRLGARRFDDPLFNEAFRAAIAFQAVPMQILNLFPTQKNNIVHGLPGKKKKGPAIDRTSMFASVFINGLFCQLG
jgi:hypothetical protein